MSAYHLEDRLHDISTCEGTARDDKLRALKLTERLWSRNSRRYSILRYDKKRLDNTDEDVCSTGLFRSVVLDGEVVKSFAPPKSLDPDSFVNRFSSEDCYAEEFIEGTMINVFYDETLPEDPVLGKWEIATRSSVGAELRFFMSADGGGKTFRAMFIEALEASIDRYNKSGHDACGEPVFENAKAALDSLPTCYCYSLVLQHPDNRIVTPIEIPSLYLVGIYSINNETKCVRSVSAFEASGGGGWGWLCTPERYDGLTYEAMKSRWAGKNSEYTIPGVIVRHKTSDVRTKFRNPQYEEVRQLRGNQPKQQFRYLSLRQRDRSQLDAYLSYYPEESESFTKYRRQVQSFTSQLHQHYMRCKVRKQCDIKDVPYQYRNHVYQLHGEYLQNLRAQRKHVTRKVVEDYVNGLPPPRLMYSINYSLGQNNHERVCQVAN